MDEIEKECIEEGARREMIRAWLCSGGGGHEDGMEGLRATSWTSEGLIDMLMAYEEHLLKEHLITVGGSGVPNPKIRYFRGDGVELFPQAAALTGPDVPAPSQELNASSRQERIRKLASEIYEENVCTLHWEDWAKEIYQRLLELKKEPIDLGTTEQVMAGLDEIIAHNSQLRPASASQTVEHADVSRFSGWLKYHESQNGWDDSFSLVDGTDDLPEKMGWMPLVLDGFKKFANKLVIITVAEHVASVTGVKHVWTPQNQTFCCSCNEFRCSEDFCYHGEMDKCRSDFLEHVRVASVTKGRGAEHQFSYNKDAKRYDCKCGAVIPGRNTAEFKEEWAKHLIAVTKGRQKAEL